MEIIINGKTQELEELYAKLDLLNKNKLAIERKLEKLSTEDKPYKEAKLRFQLKRLEAPLERTQNEISIILNFF